MSHKSILPSDKVYRSKNFGDFIVLENNGNSRVKIKFIDTLSVITVSSCQVNTGAIRDPNLGCVWGVGFVGIGRFSFEKHKLAGNRWRSMLTRCYSEKFQATRPTYIGCSVCDEWHNFQNFAEWFEVHHIKGYELDKDIKVKGNKVYSPKTCLFVPKEINSKLLNNQASRGDLPIGVSKVSRGKPYAAKCSISGKVTHIGSFDTKEQASRSYMEAKNVEIRKSMRDYPELSSYLAVHLYKI